jgi:hypothetical protein
LEEQAAGASHTAAHSAPTTQAGLVVFVLDMARHGTTNRADRFFGDLRASL